MGSSFGRYLHFTVFGQSHSPAIGVTIEGLPAGFSIDMDKLQAFMDRRAPGLTPFSTSRKETDRPIFLSGLVGNKTCGAPVTAIIENTDVRSQDYSNLVDCPRPGHADYTAQMKYHGHQDSAGGGHFSGRLTAPLCAVGGICLQILEEQGIFVGAHIASVGTVGDPRFDPAGVSIPQLLALQKMSFPVLDEDAGARMKASILEIKQQGNSLGGTIECAAVGLPAGLGDPMFDGMENRISQAVFAIPGVRGIEFGSGFAATTMTGSRHNDPFLLKNGDIVTKSNHHGGILGGITSGMPLIFRVAVKPTSSIATPQSSVSFSMGKAMTLTVTGRHDPCIVPRAVPCVEAAAAVSIFDAWLQAERSH